MPLRLWICFLIIVSPSLHAQTTRPIVLCEISYQYFLETAELYDHSYRYTTQIVSDQKYEWNTRFVVVQGKVVERYFEAFRYQKDGTGQLNRVPWMKWAEEGENLGIHPDGMPLMTLEELYKKCILQYLRTETANYEMIFQQNPLNGVLKRCGIRKTECSTDCFEGYSVTSFEWIKP